MKASEWNRQQRLIFWLAMIAALLLPRLLLQHALPVYLFSDDSHSYLLPAFNWTQLGEWEPSTRRGTLYPLLLAGSLHFFQSLPAIVPIQHLLGALAVCLTVALLPWAVPARLLGVALAAAASLALCGYVIFFENLVRSEILLLLFSALAFWAWGRFLLRRTEWNLGLAGLGFALATMVKNLLLPFPLLVGIFICLDGAVAWKTRLRRLGLLLAGIALPFLAEKTLYALGRHQPAPAPQSGILLFGRVAQWTVLDSSRQPEIKALIRDDIEAYRKLPRLNNNVILKRTAVPKIYAWVQHKRGSEADVNRICRDLALEAIRARPAAWLAQIGNDLRWLHWKMEFPLQSPTGEDLADARLSTTKMKHQHPMLRQQETLDFLARPALDKTFRPYHAVTAAAWLFRWHPVLLTTLFLPALVWLDRDPARRRFWLTCAAVWFFDVAIICTVGRPIPRYLVGVLPIMFWTLSGAFLHAVVLLVRRSKGRHFSASSPPACESL